MQHYSRHESGFTLIELMIVVVVVAILTAVALPAYQDSVMKSRRADAKAALSQLAQFMERNYSIAQRYDKSDPAGTTAISLPYTASPIDGATKYYDLSLVAAALAQNTYTLQAVPRSGTSQANDVCATLTLDNTSLKGTSSGRSDCW